MYPNVRSQSVGSNCDLGPRFAQFGSDSNSKYPISRVHVQLFTFTSNQRFYLSTARFWLLYRSAFFFFFSQDLTSSARPHRHYASASPITSAQFPSRNRRELSNLSNKRSYYCFVMLVSLMGHANFIIFMSCLCHIIAWHLSLCRRWATACGTQKCSFLKRYWEWTTTNNQLALH